MVERSPITTFSVRSHNRYYTYSEKSYLCLLFG